MSNKSVNKRDLIMNQAEELLINMLKNHADDEFCNYVYLELTLGVGIERYGINSVKNEMLIANGTFRAKGYRKNGEQAYYSMNDLLSRLIYFLGESLRERALADRSDEIKEKYGTTNYLWGIGHYLKEILLGIKSDYSNKHHNEFEKMIEEYILRA